VPYSTKDQVRYALTRDPGQAQGTAASLGDSQLDDAILEADARIGGRLASRYQIPFVDPAPILVSQISRDIAAYLADLSFREVRDYNSALNPVYLRYQDALKLLDQIAEGKVVLPDVPGTVTPSGASEAVIVINQTDIPLFSAQDFGLGVSPSPFWCP
jgi:phage gp36-like protein